MRHPKAALVERALAEGRGKPVYDTQRSGPDHEPLYRSEVAIDGTVHGHGEGGNKREAERRAADAALLALDQAVLGSDNETGAAAFDGPWPLIEPVLAASLHVAHARVPSELRGDAAREAVQAFALKLYKGVLGDLGEVVEDEEEAEA